MTPPASDCDRTVFLHLSFNICRWITDVLLKTYAQCVEGRFYRRLGHPLHVFHTKYNSVFQMSTKDTGISWRNSSACNCNKGFITCTLKNGDVFNKRALLQCCLTSNPTYSHGVEAVILRPQTSNEEAQFYTYKMANFSLADLCTKFSA